MPMYRLARLGLVCVTLTACGTAPAFADEGVAIKNLLGGMGVIPKDKDPIQYRERAPLVLPPKLDLPAPAAPESYASTNPQWPKDPDVAAKKRRLAEQRRPVTESEIRRMSENNPTMSIDEIRQGRSASAEQHAPGNYMTDHVDMTNPSRTIKASSDDEGANSTTRRTLAEPPGDYRKSTRTARANDGPAPKVDQQTLDANPMNWITQKFMHKDDDDE